jgi:hypothetical protein
MSQLIDHQQKKNTIFLQAIDQNYENTKANINDFSEDNLNDFMENGDLNFNLDFIDFSDELLIKSKSEHKKSEGNLSNSCASSDSTEFDFLSVTRPKSKNKFLTENKTSFKIKDFLSSKFEDNSNNNLTSEIQKLKENYKQATIEKIVSGNNDNKINSFTNFLTLIHLQNNIKKFCQNSQQRTMSSVCSNYPNGFFQQQQAQKQNINLESSLFQKHRKYSYQAAYTSGNYLEF